MQEAKRSQRHDGEGKAQLRGAPADEKQGQAHDKEGQAVEKVDGDDLANEKISNSVHRRGLLNRRSATRAI